MLRTFSQIWTWGFIFRYQNYKLNTSEYAFVIIDDENIYTEIKLKVTDIPINFIKKKSIKLYYLNLNKGKDENNNQTEDITQSHTMHESIREGELLKYSFKHSAASSYPLAYNARTASSDNNFTVSGK